MSTTKPSRTRTARADDVSADDAEGCGLTEQDLVATREGPGAGEADGAGAAAAVPEVEVTVRPGEVVVRVRGGAWGGALPDVRVDGARVGGELSFASEAGFGALAADGDGTVLRTRGFTGLAGVKADKVGQGFGGFRIRTDLVEAYDAVREQALALGGIVSSSGGLRDLSAPVTPGRSRTSLHYTGRAIDLFIFTGMQGASDRYLVRRAGGTDANPEWEVLCVSVDPKPGHPLFDASLLKEGEVEYLVWKKRTAGVKQKRTVRFFSLTELFARRGWVRIPARSDWKTNYTSVEWWHFQHHKGLVDGRSRFGDQLREVWPADQVARSGLALEAVFRGRSFRA